MSHYIDGGVASQKKRAARWYLANKAKHHRLSAAWAKNHPKKRNRIVWASHLRRRYGMTVEQHESLYKKQKGKCAICGARPGKRRLSTDHCHETNRVRGLLCQGCNVFLGFLETKMELFPKVWRYLLRR